MLSLGLGSSIRVAQQPDLVTKIQCDRGRLASYLRRDWPGHNLMGSWRSFRRFGTDNFGFMTVATDRRWSRNARGEPWQGKERFDMNSWSTDWMPVEVIPAVAGPAFADGHCCLRLLLHNAMSRSVGKRDYSGELTLILPLVWKEV